MTRLTLVACTVLVLASATPALAQPQAFRDCARCPEMVSLPAGSPGPDASGHPRLAPIKAFAMGRYEVTRDEFTAFVAEVGHGGGICQPGEVELKWCNLPFSQTGQDPVVQVELQDAQAYADWLSRKTGKVYRLPTDDEWDYAARTSNSTDRHLRSNDRTACQLGNLADRTFALSYGSADVFDCTDGFANTAPVGTFRPNGFGLYDMVGNAWEWTAACAERDGGEPCARYFMRGGAWDTAASAFRTGLRLGAEAPVFYIGFRVARSL